MKKYSIILLTLMIVACGNQTGKSNAQTVAEEAKIDSTHKIVAYYFHTTQRCASCYKIETYSKEALDAVFAAELENGQIEWRMINTDEKDNKHYVDDYQLFTKSLILAEMKDGQQVRWKLCGKVWEYLNDKPKFLNYVQTEMRAYLSGS